MTGGWDKAAHFESRSRCEAAPEDDTQFPASCVHERGTPWDFW